MSKQKTINFAGRRVSRLTAWLQAAVIASAGLLPMLSSSTANAGQLTNRKLTMSTSVPGNAVATDDTNGVGTNVTHTFDFTLADTSTLGSIELLYCTTPLGSCDGTGTGAPAGLDVSGATLDTATDTIAGSDAALSDGTNTTNLLQVTKTANTASGVVHLEFNGITNPNITSGAYTPFYVRINVYSDAAYTTLVDSGTVAGTVTQQLVVNGRVQERLEFCVAALDNAATTPADCSAFPTAFTIDIGVIDDSAPAISPVANDGFNGSNDDYGVAMVDTNASGGVKVYYFPEADETGTNQLRNFRINGASCDPSEATFDDQCFQSAATGGTNISSNGERFGMQIACVDRSQSDNSTANLLNNNTAYQGDNVNTTCEDTEASTVFAWDNSGNPVEIASSTSVVNDEMLKIRFGAKADATTPTGSYTVTTTYIATATF